MFLVVVFPHKMSINGRTKSLIPSLLEKKGKETTLLFLQSGPKAKVHLPYNNH